VPLQTQLAAFRQQTFQVDSKPAATAANIVRKAASKQQRESWFNSSKQWFTIELAFSAAAYTERRLQLRTHQTPHDNSLQNTSACAQLCFCLTECCNQMI
jgi:thiamine biosynthesis protein ThiC